MREAPSLTIIPKVLKSGAKVIVCDPKGKNKGEKLLEGVKWMKDPYVASKKADLLVILTEWNEFRALDLKKIAKNMADPILVDLKNIYSKDKAIAGGFRDYVSVGRETTQNS